jgi:hypothetical protein
MYKRSLITENLAMPDFVWYSPERRNTDILFSVRMLDIEHLSRYLINAKA